MLPIPALPTSSSLEAGPSTPGPAKRTRAGKKKDKGKTSDAAPAVPTTSADEEDGSPLAKKQRTGAGAV